MKVSAVLVGVNVAATLSVAMQNQAMAEPGTAAFLKASLSEAQPSGAARGHGLSASAGSIESRAIKTSSRSSSKASLSEPRAVATRNSLSVQGVKLRPFVPNRRLPSKRDFETALESQSASYDYAQAATASPSDSALTGSVSESAPYFMPAEYGESLPLSGRSKYELRAQQRRNDSRRLQSAAKVASSYHRAVTPRAVPGGSPSIPGQVGYPCAQTSMQPLDFNQPVERLHNWDRRGTLMSGANSDPLSMSGMNAMASRATSGNMGTDAGFTRQAMPYQPNLQVPAPQMELRPSQIPVEAPLRPLNLSPQEQMEMNRLLEMTNAQTAGRQEDLYARVGPPPFPLCLIPEQAMTGFLKRAHERHSYAGDSMTSGLVNGNGGMASGSMGSGGYSSMLAGGGGGTALPHAGFRSYVHGAKTAVGMRSFARLASAPVIKQGAHGNQVRGESVNAAARQQKPQQSSVSFQPAGDSQRNKALTYPPYKSSINFGS